MEINTDRTTRSEDAALDSTMKSVGILVALIAAVVAIAYFVS